MSYEIHHNVECMSGGTYTEPLNYATNFNVPLLIHIVVCSTALKTKTMIELQYFNGTEWTTVSTWANEWMAWVSLGGDDYNYRTVDENGKVLTDKSGEF